MTATITEIERTLVAVTASETEAAILVARNWCGPEHDVEIANPSPGTWTVRVKTEDAP